MADFNSESLKFSGGWEVKLRDLAAAGEKVTAEMPATQGESTTDFLTVAEQDPNLALVALRIEIEKRLRSLADSSDIPSNQPLSRLFRELQRREVLTHPALGGLQEIVMAGNQAAHGATVEPGLADWAFSNGREVLSALDSVLREKSAL